MDGKLNEHLINVNGWDGRFMSAKVLALLPGPDGDSRQGADATREKLLAATHALLVERGGGQISVNDICARAEVNVAMVKYCFGGKSGMMQALIDRISRGFIADLQRLDALGLPPSERLIRHVSAIIKGYVRYPYINRLINEQLLSADPEGVSHFSRTYAVPMRDWYARLLEEGSALGEFRTVDPVLFFFTTLGMAEFFFTAQPLMRAAFSRGETDSATLGRFTRHVTAMLIGGLSSNSRPRA